MILNFSCFSLQSIAWLIVQTVLPINACAGEIPLSLGWTLALYVIRIRLIDLNVSLSPICIEQGSFNVSANFSAWPFD